MFSHSGGGQQAVQYLLGFLFLTICSISLTCLSRSLILFVSAALSLALCVASYDLAFCVEVKNIGSLCWIKAGLTSHYDMIISVCRNNLAFLLKSPCQMKYYFQHHKLSAVGDTDQGVLQHLFFLKLNTCTHNIILSASQHNFLSKWRTRISNKWSFLNVYGAYTRKCWPEYQWRVTLNQ